MNVCLRRTLNEHPPWTPIYSHFLMQLNEPHGTYVPDIVGKYKSNKFGKFQRCKVVVFLIRDCIIH